MMKRRDLARPAAALAALLLFPFCGGSTSTSGGSSESHFLEPCEAECGEGLVCACRICTRPCGEDAECRRLDERSTCEPSIPGCPEAPHSSCDVACGTDAECRAVRAGLACVTGRCRQPEDCFESATARVLEFARANRACAEDEDCQRVRAPCYSEELPCGSTLMSSGYDEGAFGALIEELSACALPDACECPEVGPIAFAPPACFRGTCTVAYREADCAELGQEACAFAPGCSLIEGRRWSAEEGCYEPPAAMGCSADVGPPAITVALDPEGACWVFPSLTPAGWIGIGGSECPGADPHAQCVGDDVPCADRAPEVCVADAACEVIAGQRWSAEGCYQPPTPVGCYALDEGCGTGATSAIDPDGACWMFPSTCVPAGWASVGDDPYCHGSGPDEQCEE